MNDESYLMFPIFIRPTVTTYPIILTKYAIKGCIRKKMRYLTLWTVTTV